MPTAPEPKLDALIQDCSLSSAQACFRKLCPSGFKRSSAELENPDGERFTGFTQFGELPLNGDTLLFVYAETETDLSQRSARKAQFDAARELLKARGEYDAGIFIYRGANGAFRLSLISKIYKATKAEFSHFRRYTYFVDPATDGNGTFIRQISGCAFDSLEAIQEAFSVEAINTDFYKELANWYFWAMKHVHFPTDDVALDKTDILADKQKVREHDAKNLIRLLTRMLFVWFIKQRGLVPHELFDAEAIARDYLEGFSPDYLDGFASQSRDSRYYKAILQNFFFAALNQERSKREFRKMGAAHRDNMSLMRYKDAFKDPNRFLHAVESTTPFLNGGLFECLDFLHPTEKGPSGGAKKCYEDGFSDHKDNPLVVPDFLFFAPEHKANLSETWGIASKSNEPVLGLIHILNRYNFTIVENSPIEQEVALDPELLGKVFENLLASYNPETKTTARKQTGSFYTPRPIVDYMVDESLKAYLLKPLTEDAGMNKGDAEAGLDLLFSYEEKQMETVFEPDQVGILIRAIDRCKILDPACGSGAFPMGILQKLVFVLGKLDPDNEKWEQRQVDEAQDTIKNKKERRDRICEIMNDFEENDDDYGRKLYLIENCLYGVDIQSIATQVSKLRFFISLVVDQNIDREHPDDNFGVRPLPNLETKFVTANTLIAAEKPSDQPELSALTEVKRLQDELRDIRHKIFSVKTTKSKQKYKEDDKAKREEIAAALKANGWPDETADRLAKWDPYKQNDSADFFDPDWMFGLKGFDVVIGNPPYISVEKFTRTKQQEVWRKTFKTFAARGDIYCFFYERGLTLLRQGGFLGFITSNKFQKAGYGKALRQLLAAQRIEILVDFCELPVFKASTDPIIVIAAKAAPSTSHDFPVLVVKDEKEFDSLANSVAARGSRYKPAQLKAEGWSLEGADGIDLVEKLRSKGTPLVQFVNHKLHRGILTGFNEAFVFDRATRDRLISEDKNSARLIKPWVRGMDIKRWRHTWNGLYFFQIPSSENFKHPWSGQSSQEALTTFKKCFPAISRFVLQYEQQLRTRTDQGTYFWELRSCGYWSAFNEAKLVFNETSKNLHAYLDTEGNVINKTGFIILTPEALFVLTVLNSTALDWLYRSTFPAWGDVWNTGRVQFRGKLMNQVPIPAADAADKAKLTKLAERAAKAAMEVDSAAVTLIEREIDEIIYRLFDLTAAEITQIETALANTRG